MLRVGSAQAQDSRISILQRVMSRSGIVNTTTVKILNVAQTEIGTTVETPIDLKIGIEVGRTTTAEIEIVEVIAAEIEIEIEIEAVVTVVTVVAVMRQSTQAKACEVVLLK